MRDLLITAVILGSIPFILRRPWIGMMMWVFVSLVNPHRFTWGFAFSMPFAMLVALATFLGIIFSKEKHSFPWCGVSVTLCLMLLWMTVTTVFAIHPQDAWPTWEKVVKIQIMNLVGLYVLNMHKDRLIAFVWVVALSMVVFGVKGGIFTLLGGGEYRVYGPLGSFIEENNTLALATIMTIPILYYLYRHTDRKIVRWGLIGAMVLCAFSALGSHSRGGLLAMAAMVGFLWLKSKSKLPLALAVIVLAPVMLAFMPDHWTERMHSIKSYETDGSALGRLNAWAMALNVTKDHPIVGGGFEMYSPYTFGRWAPDPLDIHSSHSNYFQMLGEHGYPGLLLFLILLFVAWRMGSRVIAKTKNVPDLAWAGDLCRMIQVSIVGYCVGGAFLNLAYFDLPYFLISMIVLAHFYVQRELAARAAEANRGASAARSLRRGSPGRTQPA